MNWEPCRRPAPLSPNVLVTFLIHVPHRSLPEDISLSLFYWYLWCDAVWVRGLWQLTLQSGTWIVCCCAQSNNVFVTRCQTPYTPPFIFLCSIFCTTKQRYVLLSHGRYGNIWANQKSLVKQHAIIAETIGSVFSFMDARAKNALQWCCKKSKTPNKFHIRGKKHITVSILHELQWKMCQCRLLPAHKYSNTAVIHV